MRAPLIELQFKFISAALVARGALDVVVAASIEIQSTQRVRAATLRRMNKSQQSSTRSDDGNRPRCALHFVFILAADAKLSRPLQQKNNNSVYILSGLGITFEAEITQT